MPAPTVARRAAAMASFVPIGSQGNLAMKRATMVIRTMAMVAAVVVSYLVAVTVSFKRGNLAMMAILSKRITA